jgi:Family of unknown function (DUF6510)
MSSLDGNAIGGELGELYGAEMTTARCVCGSCGNAAMIAELDVYLYARGPGTVVRCRRCKAVLMVLVTIRGRTCVEAGGFAALESPALSPPAR